VTIFIERLQANVTADISDAMNKLQRFADRAKKAKEEAAGKVDIELNVKAGDVKKAKAELDAAIKAGDIEAVIKAKANLESAEKAHEEIKEVAGKDIHVEVKAKADKASIGDARSIIGGLAGITGLSLDARMSPNITTMMTKLAGIGSIASAATASIAGLGGVLLAAVPATLAMGGAMASLAPAGIAAMLAFKGIGQGMQTYSQDLAKGQTQAQAFTNATKGMDAEQKNFMKSLIQLEGPLKKVQEGVQKIILPQATAFLQEMGSKVLPVLIPGLNGAAQGVANFVKQMGTMLTQKDTLGNLKELGAGFKGITQNMGGGTVSLIHTLITTLAGVSPVSMIVSKAFETQSGKLDAWMTKVKNSGQLTTTVAQSWSILGTLGGGLARGLEAIGQVVVIAMPGLQVFANALKGLFDHIQGAVKPGSSAIFTFFNEVGKFGQQLGQALQNLGPGLATLFEALGKLASTAVGPALVTISKPLSDLLKALAGLGQPLGILIPILGQVLAILGEGLAKALVAVMPTLSDVVKEIGGNLVQAVKIIAPLLPGLVVAFLKIIDTLSPVIPIIAQLAKDVVPALVVAFGAINSAISKLMPFIGPLVTALGQGLAKAILAIAPQIPGLAAALARFLEKILPLIPKLADLAAALGPAFIQSIISLVDALTPLLGIITPLVGWIADLAGSILKIPVLGPIAAGAVGLALGWGKMASTAGGAIKGVKDFAKGLKDIPGDISNIAGKIGDFGGKLADAARGVADFGKKLGQMVADALVAAGKFIARWAVVAATFIAENITMAATAVAAFIAENLATLGIVAAVAAVIAAVVWMATHWHETWSFIKKTFDEVVHFLRGGLGTLILALAGPIGWLLLLALHWKEVWDGIKTVGLDAWHFLDNDVFQPISHFFQSLPGNIVRWLANLWSDVSHPFKVAWDWTNQYVLTPMVNWFVNLPGNIVRWLSNIWNVVSKPFKDGYDWISRNVFTPLGNWIIALPGNISRWLSNIWNVVSAPFASAWSWVERNFGNPIHDFFVNLPGNLVRWMGNIAGTVGGVFDGVWHAISTSFIRGLDAVIDFVNNNFLHPINDVLGVIGLKIPNIPVITRAEKGTIFGQTVGAGGVTGGPMVLVGEGRPEYPEYVIPTDPQYRSNAKSLAASLLRELGIPGLSIGGTIWHAVTHPVSTVTGVAKAAVSDTWDGIKKAVSDVGGAIIGPALRAIAGPIEDALRGLPPPFVGEAASGLVKAAVEDVLNWAKDKKPPKQAGNPNATAPPGGASAWTAVAKQVAGMLGEPNTWGAIIRRIQLESGGNPAAVNLWDSNAAKGTPSVGLVQVIGPTYQHYKGPDASPWAYGVSEDPLSNVYAGMNYAIQNYGSIAAIDPLVKPSGYDSGGILPPGMTLAVNNTGRNEYVSRTPPININVDARGSTNPAATRQEVENGIRAMLPVLTQHLNR